LQEKLIKEFCKYIVAHNGNDVCPEPLPAQLMTSGLMAYAKNHVYNQGKL